MQEYVQKSTSTTSRELGEREGTPSGVLIQSLIPLNSGARGSPTEARPGPMRPVPFSFSISTRAEEPSIRFWNDFV